MVKMNFESFPFITTSRLLLRNITESDVNEIFTLLSNKHVATFFQRPYAKSEQDAVEFINKVAEGIQAQQWIIWAVVLPHSDKLIGTISLWNISHEDDSAEISYEILPEYQNQGYMREAVQVVINYGFTTMRLNVIEARTSIKNERSLNLLNKLCFIEQKPVIIEVDPLGWDNPDSVTYRLYKK